MGAYHGRHIFETFTHHKAVLRPRFRFDLEMMYPPDTEKRTKMVERMM